VTDEQARHLEDVPDGAGCTEIWERLSAHRAAAPSEQEPTQVDEHEPGDERESQVPTTARRPTRVTIYRSSATPKPVHASSAATSTGRTPTGGMGDPMQQMRS
jgi:hypothetical protein